MAACSQPGSVPTTPPDAGVEAGPSPVFATLERTPCHGGGACPVYKIAIHANGEVEYDGVSWVHTLGHAVGKISLSDVAAIRALFEGARFMTRKSGDHNIDAASVITSYMPEGGQMQRVANGAWKLHRVEDEVFRIVGGERWTKDPELVLPPELKAAIEADARREEAHHKRIEADGWLSIGIRPILVAGGTYRPGTLGATNDERPPTDLVNVVVFEMSQDEVTAQQYDRCVQEAVCKPPGADCGERANRSPGWSVTCVDWEQARTFASWSGGRLPSEAEWEWAARGREGGRTYPWGNKPANCSPTIRVGDRSVCGAQLNEQAQSDSSADGIRGLARDTSEWVADAWSSRGHTGMPPDGSPRAGADGVARVVRGGSWQARTASEFRVTRRMGRAPGDRDAALGFRVVRDTPSVPLSDAERWRALGIVPIRIPGGSYRLGAPRAPRPMTVNTFELSKSEVTIEQYRQCMKAGICTVPNGIPDDETWLGPPNHPITWVTWAQARTFAAWSGGRVPTAAEWQWAARGREQGRTYPWGDEAPDCSRAIMNLRDQGCSAARTSPVCQTPAGNSLDGVCDLAGNVEELVDDGGQLSGEPYPLADGSVVFPDLIVRGGSWEASSPEQVRVDSSRAASPGGSATIGFRVARSVGV